MPTPPIPTAAPAWARRLGRLWRYRPVLKTVGVCAFTALFFQAYFFLLAHPRQPPALMPLTAPDHWIVLQPLALWPYLSLWVYVGIAPALMPTLRTLLAYGAWAAALCGAGLACFWAWPTAVPWTAQHLAPALDGHAGFALLRGVDAAGNACPSLHVGTAVFSGAWLDRVLQAVAAPRRLRLVNAGWLALIAWSTVATRQHVWLDVVAGAALGAAFAALSLRWGLHPRRWAWSPAL
ncbi:MAG: phosphatase PAP2 family protein [Rubrivivax sp.]